MARTFVSMIFDNNQFGNLWSDGDNLVTVDGDNILWPNMPEDMEGYPNCSTFVVRDDGTGVWSGFDEADFQRIGVERACGYFFLSDWMMDQTSILTAILSDDDIRTLWKQYDENTPAWMRRFYEWLPSV